MEYQLGTIALQELSLKRELISIEQAADIHLIGYWEAKVREYLCALHAGLESLNTAPQNHEERQEIFELKRDIVLALVQKVTIDRNRQLSVHFNLDILRILQEQAKNRAEGIVAAGLFPVKSRWSKFIPVDY